MGCDCSSSSVGQGQVGGGNSSTSADGQQGGGICSRCLAFWITVLLGVLFLLKPNSNRS